MSLTVHAWHTLLRAFNIQPGEGLAVALLLAHSFCMGLGVVFFYTAANALFLVAFPADTLPYVYIGSAGFVVLCGFLYTKLNDRLSVAQLLPATLIFLLLSVVAFRLGLWFTASTWLAFGLLFWLRVLVVLSNLAFWGLAARLFDVRQGKRLFGLIGAGELAANTLGGFSTPLFVMLLGTPNLLLISALGLGMCLVLLTVMLRKFEASLATAEDGEKAQQTNGNSLVLLVKNRYIALVLLAYGLLVLAYYFVDFSFLTQTKAHYQTEAQLASFLGPFFGIVEAINFLTRTLLSGRLINRYGLRVGLLAHPTVLMACTTLVALAYTAAGASGTFFWLVALSKLSDEVLWKSMDDPTFLILYQPLRASQRFAAQVAMQSIFGPLAVALAGAMLLLFGAMGLFHLGHLAFVTLAVLMGSVAVALLVQREYIGALRQALSKRTLEGMALSLHDASSLAVLQREMLSPHPGEVMYALEMLQRIDHPSLPAFLEGLLEHPDAHVRQDVLRRLERARAVSALSAVRQRLAVETTLPVRAAAVRTLCALGEAEVVEEVVPYLNEAQSQMRLETMVGLLRYGGMEGILVAGERLLAMARAPEPALREAATQVLGEVGLPSFYRSLIPLLQDDDLQVRRAALAAAGKINSPKLWPLVLAQLSFPEVATAAMAALVAGGEAVVPLLATACTSAAPPHATLRRIVRICGRIRGDQAIALLQQVVDCPDGTVRTSVLAALSQCRYRAQEAERQRLAQRLTEEIAAAAWVLAALVDIADDPAGALLHTALHHELEQTRQRLFFLLSFLYDAQAILRARDHLALDVAEKRAYALEILDVLVPQALKEGLIPLCEEATPAQRLHRLQGRFPQPCLTSRQRLRDIISRPAGAVTPWTKVCALYAAATLSAVECLEAVISLGTASDPGVRAMALWTLSQLDGTAYRQHHRERHDDANPEVVRAIQRIATEAQGGQIMLLTIEKVIILKTVSIFAETPEDILAEIASILEEVEVQSGETIITKDELGTCMYIIVDGRVRVHDGARTIAYHGARDIFGELAVLDPEPRSASVSALEETHLFRLDQEAFYALMADRIEVVRGILRVLCRRLRSRTEAE